MRCLLLPGLSSLGNGALGRELRRLAVGVVTLCDMLEWLCDVLEWLCDVLEDCTMLSMAYLAVVI